MTDTSSQGKIAKERSPSYPFIPLSTAIDRLIKFEATFGRHPAPAKKAGLAWEMKEASSQAFQTLAALKAYGLIEYQGSAASLSATITDLGRRYLRAQQESVKREVIREAALKPKAIAKYWGVWGASRPPTPVCLDQLVLDGGFTQSAAETFLRVYDATIAYAGLKDSDTEDAIVDEYIEKAAGPKIDVGDLVLVELNGQLVTPSPVRVRAVQEHQGQVWAFVEGSETGLPMESLQLHQKAAVETLAPPVLPIAATSPAMLPPVGKTERPGWKEERLVDDEGDETFLSYKGEPSVERYEFIRDYLNFRINRLKKVGG